MTSDPHWNPQSTQRVEVTIKLDPTLERRLVDIALALVKPVNRQLEKIMTTAAELHQMLRDLFVLVDRLVEGAQNSDSQELQDMAAELQAEKDKISSVLPPT